MTDVQLAAHFFLQLAVILLACRAVGWLASKIGQTQVIGEMVAGILLGPSLLGVVLPSLSSWLFPRFIESDIGARAVSRHPSMSILYVASQFGLALYMFLVGLELDLSMLKMRRRGAVWISLSGIVVPFLLGGAVAACLFSLGGFFSPGVPQPVAMLFLGASIAITAFPMLARIIGECGLAKTSIGTLALAAAAANDAAAWCLLAVVIAFADAAFWPAVLAIAGGAAFVLAAVYICRPALKVLERYTHREDGVQANVLVAVVASALLCSYLTEAIGIHSIFGAFIFGVILPRGQFATNVITKLSPLVRSILLPIFFVCSGLNTSVGLLDSLGLWLITGAIIVTAVAGKGIACALAARLSGEPWRDSVMIGTLMNARGLVELIILNIGLQRGFITPALFTMMVLMAVITTLMVSPIFNSLYGRLRADPNTVAP